MFTFAVLGLGNAFAQLERVMGRFFFDLQGKQNVTDPTGLAFGTKLDAFRAAQRLAAELSSTRPNLRGNTCVVVIHRRDGDTYYVSV